ncbi:MAG: hypothetical protein EPO21_13095 [Chloroflexota bacterium]|nr:MAG: hypothetical protein EPO21_13095 [Chloroflexota bacterium]
MSRALTPWNRLVQAELRALPKGATQADRAKAMQRAAAKWNSGKGRRSGRTATRSNPSSTSVFTKQLLVVGGLLVAGYLVYRRFSASQATSPCGQCQKTPYPVSADAVSVPLSWDTAKCCWATENGVCYPATPQRTGHS